MKKALVQFLIVVVSLIVGYYIGRSNGAPDKPCGVGRADANPKLVLNDT